MSATHVRAIAIYHKQSRYTQNSFIVMTLSIEKELTIPCVLTMWIDHLHNYGPGTRFGASSARIGCNVCFSFELSFFSCFWMSFSDRYGVPGCSNRGRAGPLLFSHSFPRSSELRELWLFTIRQADWWNFRVPNSTVEYIEHFEHVFRKKKFGSCSCLKACGLFHYQLFETEEG